MESLGLLDEVLDEYVIIQSSDCSVTVSPLHERKPSCLEVSCGKYFTEALRLVVNNESFRKDDFQRHKLLLCECYCLLWQHSVAGNWEQLYNNEHLRNGVHAAVLLDLYVIGKIKFSGQSSFPGHTDFTVEVIDDEPTFTFIDSILFDKILKQASSSRSRKWGSTRDWLSYSKQTDCVRATVKNLVSRGILGTLPKGHIFSSPVETNRGRRTSTLNFGPIKTLEREIKAVALKQRKPDSFMLSLLTLSMLDSKCVCNDFLDPIQERYFTRKEYLVAKENIRSMVRTQGMVLRSPRFRLKKYSVERNKRV